MRAFRILASLLFVLLGAVALPLATAESASANGSCRHDTGSLIHNVPSSCHKTPTTPVTHTEHPTPPTTDSHQQHTSNPTPPEANPTPETTTETTTQAPPTGTVVEEPKDERPPAKLTASSTCMTVVIVRNSGGTRGIAQVGPVQKPVPPHGQAVFQVPGNARTILVTGAGLSKRVANDCGPCAKPSAPVQSAQQAVPGPAVSAAPSVPCDNGFPYGRVWKQLLAAAGLGFVIAKLSSGKRKRAGSPAEAPASDQAADPAAQD